jgi:outer membrane receptor protein involved in Fe transport
MKPLLLPALLLTLTAQAQVPADSVRLLDEVTVTARRSAQRVFDTPASVSTLGQGYLRTYQPRTTPEALQGTVGVFVQKTNHGGGSPFLRGLTGNQTLTLIDGIRLNNSTFRYGPNQYLNTVDALSLDRIEVLRGGGSVAYGTDALGGTLQLFTRNPEFGRERYLGGRVLSRVATSQLERTARFELSGHGERLAWSAGATIRGFGDLVGGDTTGRQSPSGYSERAFDLKTRLRVGRTGVLTLAHQYLQQRHVPVYHKVILENFMINEMDPQRRNLSYARFETRGRNRLFREIQTTLSLQATREGRISQKNGSPTRRTETDRVQTAGLTVNVNSEFSSRWTANSGLELYHDWVGSTKVDVNGSTGVATPGRGLYPDGSTYGNYAFYSLHQLELGRTQVTFGGRFNGFDIRVPDATLGNVRLTPAALVGNASALYRLADHSNVYAAVSTGFRAPNVDDLGTLGIVDFRYELPTASLKPEQSVNYELGYKLRTPRVAAGIAAFYSDLQNLITRVKVGNEQQQGYPVYRKENTEKALIRGLEVEAEAVLFAGLKAYGQLTSTYGQNLTKAEPLRRVPPMNGRFGLEYRRTGRIGSVFVRPETVFAATQDRLAAGDRDDNRIPKGGTPGWTVFNVLVGMESRWFLVNLNFQNLTNADYRTHGSGINGVGRSVWLALSVGL